MRSIITPIALILLLAGAAIAQTIKPANYAGKWVLDAPKSKNLPPYYANIQSHRLDIKQTKTALTVDVELTFNNGNEPFRITLNYMLDGTSIKIAMPIRTPQGPKDVPTTLSGELADDGKLKLNIVNELEMNGKPFKGLTTEEWQLADQGKSLLIHLTRDAPQGRIEYDLLFTRQ